MSSAQLSQKYLDLFATADRLGVSRPLNHLIATSGADEEAHIDVCVAFVTKRSVRDVLSEWAEADRDSAELLKLSDALLGVPQLTARFHAPDPAIKRSVYYYGRTEELPVVMCLGVRRPSGDDEYRFCFDQLRVWVILQGYQRVKRHQTHDKSVAAAADRLRLAGDDDETVTSHKWLQQFSRPWPSAAVLTRYLRLVAPNPQRGEVVRAHADFCKALRRLARDEYERADERHQPNSASPLNGILAAIAALQQPIEELEPADAASPLEAPPATIDAKRSELADLSAIEVTLAEGASQTEGLLTGRGLQIRAVESLQFLRWSWDTPTDYERHALISTMTGWQTAERIELRLLALVCRAAVLTSRSVRLAQNLSVSMEARHDWSITPDLTMLHRLRPRRSSGLRISEAQRTWVRPLLPSICLPLNAQDDAFTEHANHITNLDQLWKKVWPQESAERLFNRLCGEDALLQRISSGRLAGVFAQTVYRHSTDGVLAQMLAQGASAALGGNCAYASWPVARVSQVLDLARIPLLSGDMRLNAAGSELDPVDEKLRETVEAATLRLGAIAQQPDQWLTHHNLTVTYVVTALLAATGARPVTDPFESPTHIDWEKNRLFLSEKATRERAGRLVPLPACVVELLRFYLRHLHALSDLLAGTAGALSDQMALLAQGKESKCLPFFFFLNARAGLHWQSVSEESLAAQSLFDWTLPWNLMRHRLSTRLRALGADTEIIDALLGHADQGVLTHGIESPRTWADDMKAIAPLLEQTYAALGFSNALCPAVHPETLNIAVDEGELLSVKPFGSAAREWRRRAAHRTQTRQVLEAIKEALNGRKWPGRLSREEWDQLANRLLTLDGHRRHPNYRFRYRVLQRIQLRAADTQRLKLGRVYVLDREVASPYRECAIGSDVLLRDLRTWFDGPPSRPPPSRLGAREALALAAIDLILMSRVTAPELLRDVLRNANYLVVVHESQTFLEHHHLLDRYSDAPVVRHRITNRCATWLNAAQDRTFHVDAAMMPVPHRWHDCPGLVADGRPAPRTVGDLVHKVAAAVEQANFIERPGLIAGYAAGQLVTTALPRNGWVLHTRGRCPSDSSGGQGRAASALAEYSPSLRRLLKSPPRPDVTGFDPARRGLRLLAQLRLTLAAYRSKEKKHKHIALTRREDLTQRMADLVEKRSGRTSSAIWCLATWTAVQTERGPNRSRPYAISTVKRYLGALSARFLQVGSHFDLLRADSDSIADFYSDVLEVNRDLDLRYVVGRLQAFHSFVRDQFGVDDVDWGELDCGSAVPHGSPGLVGLPQYQNALDLLAPVPADCSHAQLAAAFLLILSFKFGLRSADALGLQGRDWREVLSKQRGTMVVIQVMRNELRDLKRDRSGLRLVPQLEPFSTKEAAIAKEFMGAFASQRLADPSFPLFAKDIGRSRFDRNKLGDEINRALQLAHRDRITLHKGRHSYGSMLAQALMEEHLQPAGDSRADPEHSEVRQLLLGTDRPTRRAPWALCRCLGHSRPAVTFKSYVHFLPLWADAWNCQDIDAVDRQHPARELRKVTFVGAGYIPWEPVTAKVTAPTLNRPGISDIANYIGNRRAHVDVKSAARLTHLSPALAAAIERHLAQVTRVLDKRTSPGRPALRPLHHHLNNPQWAMVVEACKRAETPSQEAATPVPASVQAGLRLLSARRQLVLWENQHFAWVAGFLRRLGLSETEFVLLYPRRLSAKPRAWIAALELSAFSQGGERPLPLINAAATRFRGTVTDRCALSLRPRPSPTRKPKSAPGSRGEGSLPRSRGSSRSQSRAKQGGSTSVAVPAAPASKAGRRGAMTGNVLALMWLVYLVAFCPEKAEKVPHTSGACQNTLGAS